MHSHHPVLLAEALTGLGVIAGCASADAVFIDGTFGRGGHSGAILDALAGRGALHAFDQDPEAEVCAALRFGDRANFIFHRRNFSELRQVAETAGLLNRCTGILLDLGVSSPQFDDAARGFSFSNDGPLDMRMNPQAGDSAAEWLATAQEEEIADVLFQFGDERNSRRIARRIVEARDEAPLIGTAQLAALIASVPGPRSKKIHPATRSFQAIRIHINGELDALRAVLAASLEVLAPGGRLAVISFHSLEDRMVKQFIREARGGRREAKNKYAHLSDLDSAPVTPHAPFGRVETDTKSVPLKPGALTEIGRYFPTDAECARNPRARSAVLRVAERQAALP